MQVNQFLPTGFVLDIGSIFTDLSMGQCQYLSKRVPVEATSNSTYI